MKKRLITLTISVVLLALLVHFSGILSAIFKPNTIRAAGDLIINFHVPEGDPIFVVENMLPGDFEERNIDVTNGGTIQRMVKMRAVRTGGIGDDPKLETILDIVIKENGTPIYGNGSPTGAKTVEEFFSDFSDIDGTFLSFINPSESITYNFEVFFPHEAGNEFMNKSVIFDLIFGDGTEPTPTPTNTPTPTSTPTPTPTATPTPTPTTPPTGNLCDQIKVNIFGNGSGSVNGVFIICVNNKVVSQTNTTIVNTNINGSSNTGGNTSSGNTGTSTTTTTGSSLIQSILNIFSSKNRTR